MAVILAYSPQKRRRPRPARPGEARGEIVIFTGVRIDRPPVEYPAVQQQLALPQPQPGRGF